MSLTEAGKVKRLRTLLVRACNAHIKKGGKIRDRSFTKDGACCPIRCATGAPTVPYTKMLTEKLKFDFSPDDMWSFIRGFDGDNNNSLYSGGEEYYKLGQELRKKYIGRDK